MPPRTTPPSLFAASEPAGSSTWITAHCDGGARGNPGPAGYGVEVTDATGHVVAELSEFLGVRTNNYAEYSGLLASLQFALDHGHRRLRVISDSELMVKQIQGKYKVNSPDLKPLWQEAKNRIARLDAFDISHALRHKNKAADALANQAMDRGMKRPQSPGQSSAPILATPYPTRATAPPQPKPAPPQPIISRPDARPAAAPAADTMLRGFTRDGVVHILGNATLPDGVFVKIIRE
jgi:probable phosphoglycerate mutase